MQYGIQGRDRLRYSIVVALVVVLALPAMYVQAADDPATAAMTQLPPGYTVTYTQIVDLGGDGQMEAIIKADSAQSAGALPAAIVGVLTQQGGHWQLFNQSTPYPNSGTGADIFVYPKNDQHPGFIIMNQHICGANCNGGTYTLMQYASGTFMPTLSGINDRGELSADPTTGAVTLTGPVYAQADPRCCAQYRYTRSWTWQGNTLSPGNLAFAPAPDKTVPAWLTRDGAPLTLGLNGFVAGPVVGDNLVAAAIAPALADTVTIKDAANNACMASRGAVAQALVQGVSPGGGAVWPVADGYNLALYWNNRAIPNGVMADGCTLDAGNGGGYVLHLVPSGNGFVGDTLFATPQIFMNTPPDAIQLPPL